MKLDSTAMILFISVCLAGTFGCKPKDNSQVIADKVVASEQSLITGQIFIVTKGRQNVVLGDEKVALVDEEKVRKYFVANSPQWSNDLAAAELVVQQAQTNYDKLYKDEIDKYTAAKKYHDNILATVPSDSQAWSDALDWSSRLNGKISDLLKQKRASDEYSKLKEAVENQSRLWNKINWPSADYFSPSIDSATTDSQGRFKFVVPTSEENLALLAKSSRNVGDETENYWWLVRIYPHGKSTEVILSNDNKDGSGMWGFLEMPTEGYFIQYAGRMDTAKFERELDDIKNGSKTE